MILYTRQMLQPSFNELAASSCSIIPCSESQIVGICVNAVKIQVELVEGYFVHNPIRVQLAVLRCVNLSFMD
jgi:hypothetical protein